MLCGFYFKHFSLVQARTKRRNPEFCFLQAFLELIFPTPVSGCFLGTAAQKSYRLNKMREEIFKS